jgi:hypothetical protein
MIMLRDKEIILVGFFLLLFLQIVSAQMPQSKIEKLQLGHINCSFSLDGTSIRTDVWGRYSRNKFYPWFNIFENPALIIGERSPKIILHFAPGVSYGFTKLSRISSIISDELDTHIKAYRTDDLQVNYPAIDLKLKRKMSWPEGLFVFPFKKYQIGLSIHRSLSVSMLFDWIGSETTISTILNSGGVNNKVILNNYLDGSNELDYFVYSGSFTISRAINQKIILGFQAERLYYDLYISGNWNIQGSMLYNGKEFLFNDPETLWPTDISQSLQAHYTGVGWQLNLGTIFIAKANWIADGSISFSSNVSMTGNLSGNRNKIPALNVEALQNNAGVDEILDPEKLNLSKLTLTQSVPWKEHSVLKETMPVQLKIGLMHNIGNWGFYFSDKFYFGKYRWQYGKDFVELSPLQHIKFYVSRKNVYTKFAVYLFKVHSPDYQQFAFQSGILALPSCSFGYCKKFMKQLALIGSLGILPIPGLNFGVQYEF